MLDKKKFVESVIARKLGLDEIIKEARKEIYQTEFRSHPARGAPANRATGSDVRFLRMLEFFLISEVKSKPTILSDDDFQLLFRVAKYLLNRGDLEPNVLELFSAG